MGAAAVMAQLNLFSGAAEPVELRPATENLWLFDPDFGVKIPDDSADREIIVTNGVALCFPAWGMESFRSGALRKPPVRVNPGQVAFAPEMPRVARSQDAAQLILSGFGIGLGKSGERLQVRVRGKVAKDSRGELFEFPFFRLSEVVIASSGVSLSSDLIRELCEYGIRLSFIERSGRPYALVQSPAMTATVESRRAQLAAFDDGRGLEFARQIVRGKLRNQRNLLNYCGKYLRQADPERQGRLAAICGQLRQLELRARAVVGHSIGEKRSELMGIEGAAGRIYWDAFQLLIGGEQGFPGREHRGAVDAVNSLLNYGYGILYAHVWGAIVNAGLEPFAGFLHVDRPGKPSLVLDLVEEFRQPVVDRTVIAFLNLGQSVTMENGLLDGETRRCFGQKVVERLESPEPFRGKRYQLRSIVQMQARALAAFLRGRGVYRPFSFHW